MAENKPKTQLKREISPQLLELAQHYPTVTITGPRQSGKTTLARILFPNKPYANLENPDVLDLALNDPRRFLNQFSKNGAIIDEIQRAPELFSYIQAIVDEHQVNGEFILTGSQQFNLLENITQSLAGRTAILKLLPLSLKELQQTNHSSSVNANLITGFYPRLYIHSQDANIYYRNYFETYIERDVRQLSNIKDLNLFRRFVKLCAGRVGQVFIKEHLANELGINTATVNHWLSVLEASYIIMRLEPYYENFGKRITKSPKLYFYDTGLATYLLDIETESQLDRDPLRGALFENLVIMDLVKQRYNTGKNHNLYYYREQNRHEVDVIYKKGSQLIPIEIKSSETYLKNFEKNIRRFIKLSENKAEQGYIVYAGELEQRDSAVQLINYQSIQEIM